MTVAVGRGAWTKVGMPPNGNEYYKYLEPEHVGAAGTKTSADLNHRAVSWGVQAIQTRINELGFATRDNPPLHVDGVVDLRTAWGIGWLQQKVGTFVDGEVGPKTMKGALYPYILSQTMYSLPCRQIVAGICAHESGFDPGAVGESTPDDLGLMQINGPNNPGITEAQRFDYHFAYKYALDRIKTAVATPHFTKDIAICSYGYPAVALAWSKGQTYKDPLTGSTALNDTAHEYVNWVNDWIAKNPAPGWTSV